MTEEEIKLKYTNEDEIILDYDIIPILNNFW